MKQLAFKIIRKTKRVCQKGTALLADFVKGDKLPFYCPCCDTRLRGFINGGYDKIRGFYSPERYASLDQKVICPFCGSLPRHGILVSWMQEHKDQFSGKEILHFAQEKCVRRWLNRNQLSCTTADLYQSADLQVDIQDTGLNDSAYDVVICNHVLEHVSDYKKALRELYRIFKPGGMILLSFPVDETLESVYEDKSIDTEDGRRKHFGQNDHLRVFGRDSKQLLENFGFKVEEIRGEDYDSKIKPVKGPADYDYNVLWRLTK